MYPVFNTMLLRPAADDPLPGQAAKEPPGPVIVVEEGVEQEEWVAVDIKDSGIRGRGKKRKLHYLVDWDGHNATWQPWTDVLPGCDKLVKAFHDRRPDRPAKPKGYEYQDLDAVSDEED